MFMNYLKVTYLGPTGNVESATFKNAPVLPPLISLFETLPAFQKKSENGVEVEVSRPGKKTVVLMDV